MGKIVMPKNSALLNEIESVLKIYYDAKDWIPNEQYKSKLKEMIGDDQYSSSYTKKAQITSYFGFTVWEDIHNPQSKRRITPSGIKMYEAIVANDTNAIQEVLMSALETVKFGRDNYGCPDSNSDVEPPTLYVRAILDLGYLTYREFAYLLWKLEDLGANYTDTLAEVRELRNKGPIELGEEANKYADCKPIMILVRWGFLAEDESANASNGKHIVIAPEVLNRYMSRLRNLKIYNIDKDICEGVDPNIDFSDTDAQTMEQKFRAWLSKQVTVNGTPCTPSTVSNNCSALKKVCQLMDIVEYPDLTSIFDITDMDVFVNVKNIIKNHPDYEEVNKACNNRFLSTGLNWYEKFLNDMLQNNSETELTPEEGNSVVDYDKVPRISTGVNVLLYGVPGSGKSWTIEHEYCKKGTNVERLVFHPDYTYSDFIGQILPVVEGDGQVSYQFTAGPFTNILKDAYRNPAEEFILVIEEINRGNAPAIFGEVFQLLDRKTEKSDKNDDGMPLGTSEYGITNANIAKIVYGDPSHKVKIPSNLSIIGTMNTSDQNVFTLDTAFQRRWDMRLIENNFENVDSSLAHAEILDTGVTWEVFCTEINDIIVGNNVRMSSSEDKRLGAYFVKLMDLKKDQRMGKLADGEYDGLRKKESSGDISQADESRLAEIREAMKQNRRFPEKVIKYLWDDAFKFNREIIFETTEFRSLESVIRAFMYSEGIERFKMFKQNIVDALQNPDSE